MATDFAVSLRRYLTDHMAGLRGCSPNTISSYRDTFKLGGFQLTLQHQRGFGGSNAGSEANAGAQESS
jgi:hypothetical protein